VLLWACKHRAKGPVFVTALLLGPVVALACNVPVFRYALERWPAEPYEVVLFHRGTLSEADQAVADALKATGQEGKGLANLTLFTVDLSAKPDAAREQLWSRQTNAALPWVVVRAPKSEATAPPGWAGRLHREAMQSLLDSPARREIARRLLKGDSAVWLLVESGRQTADEATLNLLETELKKSEKAIQLPEPAPDDPQMRSSLPLRVAFSVLRMSRREPAEAVFLALLAREAPQVATNASPVVIPILGRGRALAALCGPQLRPDILADVCSFVAGPCSCEVKEMNPGFDLLMAADWEALAEGRVVKDPELPPLIGLAQFGSASTNHPGGLLAIADPKAGSDGRGRLARNLLVVLGVGLGALLIGTFVLKTKAGKAPE
jgi:hypothetical protein